MTTGRPVVVKQLPEIVDLKQSDAILLELQPHLDSEQPCLVFDFSVVRHLDSAGVELLLRCMEEAMKRNGDLKLAAVPPQVAVILQMSRVDRLFEIFANSADAAESYHRFSARALQPVESDGLTELSAPSEDKEEGRQNTE